MTIPTLPNLPISALNTFAERRESDRFPISSDIRYKVLNKKYSHEQGSGRTLNVSSSGVLFQTDHPILPGRKLEISMNWPAPLDSRCALRLVARGKVVRAEGGQMGFQIQQYEFRTAGRL